MSTNKSTSLSVSDIPRFNGKNFQGWSEKMISVFMIAKVYGVITGDTVKPADNQRPQEPSPPDAITNETDANAIAWRFGISITFNSPHTTSKSMSMIGRCHLGMTPIPKLWESLTEPYRDLGSSQGENCQGNLGLAQK